jgi:hypothetical protein
MAIVRCLTMLKLLHCTNVVHWSHMRLHASLQQCTLQLCILCSVSKDTQFTLQLCILWFSFKGNPIYATTLHSMVQIQRNHNLRYNYAFYVQYQRNHNLRYNYTFYVQLQRKPNLRYTFAIHVCQIGPT